MAPIENPWHSRPIDVHRWSDHPEVKSLVDHIWEEVLPEEVGKGPGPKPKMGFRKQLRVVVLDLYVAWLDDPELSIGVHMSPNVWKTNSRYNALHLSKKIIPIINALHEGGLIDMAKGSYGGAGVKGNRTTRIRASKTLQEWFARAKFSRDDIGRAEHEELIILKDDKSKPIEYQDTPDTNQMREDLKAYNALIDQTFIDFPHLEEPILEIDQSAEDSFSDDESARRRIRVGDANKRTRRIFSRGDWTKHGRFYGGWWQQISSEYRSKIVMDFEPTVEFDYQGLHVAILYAEAGLPLDRDPYLPADPNVVDDAAKHIRLLTKKLVLNAINAKDKSSAFKAFREGFSKGDFEKTLKNDQLDSLLKKFLNHNEFLKDYLFTDQGIRLMNKDAQITSIIHNTLTKQGIPVLSIHDSYIVRTDQIPQLKQVMADASEEVVGRPLSFQPKLPGREEFEWVTDGQMQWYINEQKDFKGCPGFNRRLQAFERRTGRSFPL